MLKKIKNNITHPKHAFLYIQEKFSKVFLYLLTMTLIMSLPIIILSFLNSRQLVPDSSDLEGKYYYLYQNDFEIINSELKYEEGKDFIIELGIFNITFGDKYYDTPGYYLSFKKNNIETFYNFGQGIKIQNKTYEYKNYNMENFQFKKETGNEITNVITTIYSQDKILIASLTISSIIINFVDLIMIILMLSIIAKVTRRLPFKFKEHFKVNTYIATIYAITTLIFSLFNLKAIEIIPIIIVYIYQVIAYRSIRVIGKIQVRKKDE